MGSFVHPTAIISPTAVLDDDCHVGPYCYVGPNVKIGKANRLEAFVSIGTPAEHRDYFRSEPGEVIIGDSNVFREYVTINAGTARPTQIGSNCSLLRGSHIGHDAVIRNSAILSCNVLVGGHSIIGQGANLGLNVAVHQNRAIGAYAMVGMSSMVVRNTLPFLISFGAPARPHRVNRIGLSRAGVLKSELVVYENWFQMYEQTGAINPIAHASNELLTQYLKDCAGFQENLAIAA